MRDSNRDLSAFGRLAPLLAEPGVTDVVVNGGADVWIDRGRGMQRTAVAFDGDTDVRALGRALIAAGGRHVDDAHPMMDVRFGGIRVHVVLPPIAVAGTQISIRVPARDPVELGSFCGVDAAPNAEARLRCAIGERTNILISGAAGSENTTWEV